MNCDTGKIYTPEMMEAMKKMWSGQEEKTGIPHPDREKYIPMEVEPTEKQLSRKPQKVGKNELCPCGSGKKFKKCHLILNYRCTDKRLIQT